MSPISVAVTRRQRASVHSNPAVRSAPAVLSQPAEGHHGLEVIREGAHGSATT
jgi:hypothetical protein